VQVFLPNQGVVLLRHVYDQLQFDLVEGL